MKKAARFRRILVIAVLSALGTAFLAADEATDKVDKLFAAWDKTTSPGAALAVIHDGRIIYERGYGMAKLEDGIVMTPDKIFDIGSVSKQFTATCVVMLVRDGKISLDDNVRKYIPELPDYGTPITVRHLLHHTSGLRDYNALLELAGFRGDSDCPTVEEALGVICRQKKLNYPPGQEYSYTNTGYFLLGQIVERVSGKSLNVFAQEHIFKPLGMEHTLYQEDHTQVIRDRATGYDPDGQGFKIDMSNWDETGDGNVYTSVEDLYLWDQAFYNGKLGKDVMDMLHTKGTLNDGKPIDYAFGLVVTGYKGLKVIEHGGAWAGFRAAIVRFPDEKFSAICLANLGTMDPSGLCFKVADIYLSDELKEPPKPAGKKAEAVTVDKKDLAPLLPLTAVMLNEYAGTYISSELLDARYQIKVDKDKLVLKMRTIPGAPMKALAPDKFIEPESGANIEFMRGKGGKVAGFKLAVGRAAGIVFQKAGKY